jgi:antitoxin component YwqK of YwqJK toxin-antitoxin module
MGYMKSGKLYKSANYVNGKLYGIYKEYHNCGQLKEEINYINGKVESKCIIL